ncbi:MAG: potassium channel family protein [Planctomycetota bacterium]
MLLAILTGLALASATVAIHAGGTAWWVSQLRSKYQGRSHLPASVWLLSSTAVLLLSLQMVEVVLWATVYVALPNAETISSVEEAIYFSTVTFTTLGYGDVTLEGRWRILSAMQGATGILICGWSTAVLLAVVQAIGEQGKRNR